MQDKVYVLCVCTTDGYAETGRYIKVFKTKANALTYVETCLNLEWQIDESGMEYRDVYTLNETEVI